MKLLKTILVLSLLCVGYSWAQTPAVTLAGAEWINEPELAAQKAKALNKPMLVFEMLGRLDQQWC